MKTLDQYLQSTAGHAPVSLPAYPVHQYMIIIRPTEPVLARVARVTAAWKQSFGLSPAQVQKGHILISRFSQYAYLEVQVLDYLRRIAAEAAPFRVEISGFGSIPDHTVNLQVGNPAGLTKLAAALRHESRRLRSPAGNPWFVSQPAVNLATRLQPVQYGAIWQSYRLRSFRAAFIADGMLVLRKAGQQGGWQILERMAFQNLPMQARQGLLFAA